ncbi:MAG: glycosyltransferase [Gaiellaceae bacterium]
MTRLVFITQQVDPDHPALAATIPQIAALAQRVDEVVVLADTALPDALPDNCRVRSFRAPRQVARGARFAAALAPELRPRPLGVVAHMCPIYAILAAPLARPLGIPVLLWFTHWRARPKLALAARLATRIVTVDETSFPIASRKVVPIGHAVDVDRFTCAEPSANGRLRVVALGRFSPSKRYEELFRGVELARSRGVDVALDVYGPTLTAEERAYRAVLQPPDGVTLHDPVAGSAVPALLGGYDALVSATRAGSADKAVLEAAAACVPVVASTAPVEGVLRFGSSAELADRLSELAALDRTARAGLGRVGRDDVARRHSLDSWAEGILHAL